MSLDSIQSGFISYLYEKLDSDEAAQLTNNSSLSDASIYIKYGDELKAYLVEEYNADSSIFSMSINDIINMDIEDGKLVDLDEETNSDTQKLSEESMTTFIDNADNPENFEYVTSAQTQTLEGGAVTSSVQTDTAATAGDTTAQQSGNSENTGDFISVIGDVVDAVASFIDGIFAELASAAVENAAESKYGEEVTQMLDEAYSDEDVIKALDTDGDGVLSIEEKEAFEEYAKAYDGDNEELTKEDIESALKDIKENKFSYDNDLSKTSTKSGSTTQGTSSSNKTQTTGGSSGTTKTKSSGSSGGFSIGNWKIGSSSSKQNTTETMTLEELEKEKTTKEGEVSEAQSDVNAVYSGENEAVKNAQQKCDTAEEAYNTAVEKDTKISDELKERRSTNLEAIETKQTEIDGLNSNINDAEVSISEQKSVISSDESNLQALKDALSSLNNTSSDDSEKQAEIESKKAEVQSAITEAETKLEKDKTELETREQTKKDYEDKLKTAEDEMKTLETERSEIEQEISENCSLLTKAALKTFNAAKENVESVKESEASKAKANLETKQAELDDINEQINEKKAEETKKDYAVTSGMEAAVEWARQYDDMSQNDMQSVFSQLGYHFGSGAWCADFVRMALSEGVGEENLPEWYQNVENKSYCKSIQAAGEGHQISAEEAEAGDIVLYDWDGDGLADHVGLFVDNGDGSSTITAIEGNTTGEGGSSCVEEKSRNRKNIIGIYSMHE